MAGQSMNTLGLTKAGVNKIYRVESESKRQAWSEWGPAVDTKEEFYRVKIITGFANMTAVNEGSPVPTDSKVALYTPDFYPLKYAKAYEPTLEAEETDFYGEVMNYAPSMINSYRRTMNKDACNRFANNGFDSNYTIYDGQKLYSTAHPGITGITGANTPTTPRAFGSLALEAALQDIMAQTDARGEPLEFELGHNLFVGTGLAGVADRTVKATGLAQSADNDPNWGGGQIRKISVQQNISSATAYFFVPANSEDHGLRMLRRKKFFTKYGEEIRTLKKLFVCGGEFLAIVTSWYGTYGDPGV